MSCQTKMPLTHSWAPVENRKLQGSVSLSLHLCYLGTEPQIPQLTTG